jgi:hypothetical protein
VVPSEERRSTYSVKSKEISMGRGRGDDENGIVTFSGWVCADLKKKKKLRLLNKWQGSPSHRRKKVGQTTRQSLSEDKKAKPEKERRRKPRKTTLTSLLAWRLCMPWPLLQIR